MEWHRTANFCQQERNIQLFYEIPVKTESDSVTIKGKARLINEGGVWKLDMTSESQSVRDATIRDLIGKPDTPGFGG